MRDSALDGGRVRPRTRGHCPGESDAGQYRRGVEVAAQVLACHWPTPSAARPGAPLCPGAAHRPQLRGAAVRGDDVRRFDIDLRTMDGAPSAIRPYRSTCITQQPRFGTVSSRPRLCRGYRAVLLDLEGDLHAIGEVRDALRVRQEVNDGVGAGLEAGQEQGAAAAG